LKTTAPGPTPASKNATQKAGKTAEVLAAFLCQHKLQIPARFNILTGILYFKAENGMELMKKVNGLILSLAVLLAVGCGSDDPKPDPDKTTIPANQGCIITAAEVLEFGNSTKAVFEFDSQRRFIRINNLTNGVLQNAYKLVDYDNAGRISRITEKGSSNHDDYHLYTYNAAGLVTRDDHYDVDSGQATLSSYLLYTYDSNNKLIRKDGYDIEQTTFLAAYSLFTYPAANTARQEKYHLEIKGAPLKHIATINYAFDNKKKYKTIAGRVLAGRSPVAA
jgi:uncharacterized protein YcfL